MTAKLDGNRLVEFTCKGCGRTEMFAFNSGRHWCDCNPVHGARFEMILTDTLKRADAMAKGIAAALKETKE